MKTRLSKAFTSVMIIICILMSVFCSSCDISSKHLEKHYDENDNDNIHGWDDAAGVVYDWDNATIQTFDDADAYSDSAYSSILFSGITEDYPMIDTVILDYRSNGEYFDGELVYEMVNDEFDVNSFVANYAIGTGVIVVCVILHVVTYGVSSAIIGSEAASSSTIVCFFAGQATDAVSYAIKFQALNAAIEAVTSSIKTNGDWETTLYRTLEAGSNGYKWGAIYGAATGGWNSKYCFVGDTSVYTSEGSVSIRDISVGDSVLSYDEINDTYLYKPVTQVIENTTNELIEVGFGNESIKSTPNHPYLSTRGWVAAVDLLPGDEVISYSGYSKVSAIKRIQLDEPIKTYNLCVKDLHTYLVGSEEIVVHNSCRTAPNQQYAGRRIHFDDPEWIADHPKTSPEEWRALAKKYPNGIYFKPVNSKGVSYPDFSEYAEQIVDFEYPSEAARAANKCLTGNRSHDNGLGDKAVGISEEYRQTNSLTWNHNENMTTLELIPKDIHEAVRHDGGAKFLEALFKL